MKAIVEQGLIAIVSLVTVTAALELGLRGFACYHCCDQHEKAGTGMATSDTGPFTLADSIRPAEHTGIIYEARPNLDGLFDGDRIRTNALGFRGTSGPAMERESDVLRIVGVGGSITWGLGVRGSETYLSLLEAKLNESQRRVEVINTAVWGHNAAQRVATVREKVPALSPDIVIMEMSGTDTQPAAFLRPEPAPLILWASLAGGTVGPSAARRLPFACLWRLRREAARTAGFEQFFAAHAELATLASERNFRVILFGPCLDDGRDANAAPCGLGTAEQWSRWRRENGELWRFRLCDWRWGAIGVRGGRVRSQERVGTAGHRALAEILSDCIRLDSPPHRARRADSPTPVAVGPISLSSDQVTLAGFWPIEDHADGSAAWTKGEARIGLRGLPPRQRFRPSLSLKSSGLVKSLEAGARAGHLVSVPLPRSGELNLPFELETDAAGNAEILLTVPTWVPMNRLTGRRDSRALGVCVRGLLLEPAE